MTIFKELHLIYLFGDYESKDELFYLNKIN
jgi:hypothetical protein